MLTDLRQREDSGAYVAPILRSWIYSHSGEPELAFTCMEQAFAERSCPLGFGVRFPVYDGIRADPRFGNLLARMKLV